MITDSALVELESLTATEITSTSSSVPSSPSNQNPSTVVRSTRRTFRHTLDARTPFPVPVVLTLTARNPTGSGVSPNPCQETHPRERHKGRKFGLVLC